MTLNAKVSLPYFDLILDQLNSENSQIQEAFGRHVHWGYWEDVNQADGTLADFAVAAERLCQRVCDAPKIKKGSRILDTGCGFGGTIASLNERFQELDLVGLNIDSRQLERARAEVKPHNGNRIMFVEGDACRLPFEDGSFDVVLAVECIFHFPSRADFFREARRVLVPGGRLALCDFVPIQMMFPLLKVLDNFVQPSVKSTYGQVNNRFTLADYLDLAKTTAFKLSLQEDITVNTLPTYPVVRRLMSQAGSTNTEKVTAILEWLSRLGLVRYLILNFETN